MNNQEVIFDKLKDNEVVKEILLNQDGTFKLIRRAETPKDYFATFDCFDFYDELIKE